MKNILFVLDRDMRSNSAIHVHSLANCLSQSGLDCVISVPANNQALPDQGAIRYRVIEHKQSGDLPKLYANGSGPDVTHCWTPRESIRKFCVELREKYAFKLVIHLEDNEELLTQKFCTQQQLSGQAEFPDTWSHPVLYREFMAEADGATVIIKELQEFVPAPKPSLTLWPGVDTGIFYPRPADHELSKQLQIPLNSLVIVYTGNVHAANATEVRSLYLAVAMLNREGIPTCLIRTGVDYLNYLGDSGRWVKPFCRELGFVDRQRIPSLLALADVLVQPGKRDEFNKYRFPSKLPEFMAMGKPLILPAVNIGEQLINGEQALVLEKADAVNIFEAVKLVHQNPELRDKLSAGALNFARENFSWPKASKQLRQFYSSLP